MGWSSQAFVPVPGAVSAASAVVAAGTETDEKKFFFAGEQFLTITKISLKNFLHTDLLLLKDTHPEWVIGSNGRGGCVVPTLAEGDPTPNIDHLTCTRTETLNSVYI